jgi:uncharacterized protein YkwD
MHKRILDYHRLLPFVLLTTLLFPTVANAASQARSIGKEQPPAFDGLDYPPASSIILDFGYLYTVEAGDDIWHLAVSHGLSMETLAEANNLKAPYWIYPGDKLWIPAAPALIKRAPPPTPTPVATPTPLPTPQPAPVVPAAPPAEAGTPEEPAKQPEVEQAGEAAPAADAMAHGIITNEAVAVAGVVAAASPAPAIREDALLIFNQMNEKRTARSLPALTWSDQLTAAAQAHAEDCALRGWGSHVGSDGARLRTRLARVGYYPSWTSENWANASGAQNAFNMWWWEGPGGPHYENILGRNYTEAGIGVAQSRWGYYYIVDFGRP